MKAMKRRLLSLFMAMVMVCTLVPVALADDTGHTLTYERTTSTEGKYQHTIKCSTTTDSSTCSTQGHSGTEDCTAGNTYTSDGATGHHQTCSKCGGALATVSHGTLKYVQTQGANTHTQKCESCNYTTAAEACTYNQTGNKCVCGREKLPEIVTVKSVAVSPTTVTKDLGGSAETITVTVTGSNDQAMSGQTVTITKKSGSSATASPDSVTTGNNGTATFTVTASDTVAGNTTFEVKAGDKTATLTVKVNSPVTITPTSNASLDSWDDEVKLTANYTGGAGTTYKWKLTGETSYFSWGSTTAKDITITPRGVSSTTQTLHAEVTVTDGGNTYTATEDVTLKIRADIEVSATVSGDYFFGDADDKSNDTVWEKIEDELRDVYDNKCTLMSVRFGETEHKYGELSARYTWYEKDDFDSIEFTADGKGSAEFPFEVEYEDKNERSKYADGILTITVTDTASSSKGDITYTAELGEDFYFDVGDFEDYFDDKFSSGELSYVIFNSASNGKVKDGRSTVSYDKDEYYVDPGRNQDDLADVYFSPNSSSKAMTGKVNFTVYGKKNSQSREGTIVIYYLNDNASDITYSTTGGKVTLDPKDFEDAYKEATGSKTAPSGLTIEFQNVPTNGTLTYTGGSRDKDLTKSTVKSNRYTTKSSGSYRLAQLTYSGTKGKDTIDYIAYSGGTAQFSGKVVFNGAPAVPTDVVVGPFYSTAGQPAAFNLNTFTAASSAMSNAVKVRFVAPANGTLTMSGASAAGIDVATSLLNLVSYQPKAGYNGTDQIIFAAYDAKNAVVASGTVNVQVIGNPTTTTPSTPGGSTGVTDVSQFKDVASGAWYRDNLATLVKKGVISGKGEGKFDPKGTVTYGEALKMVLQACGYSAVAGTGSQWAINYKNLAVSRGWISNDIDLNAAISRNATAELAAKVLGVSPVTSGSPFADDANAYAVALYYTTPQIFVGTTNPNGGKPLFENNKPLLREQVCAVICRVMDYHTQHTTNTMPDGI